MGFLVGLLGLVVGAIGVAFAITGFIIQMWPRSAVRAARRAAERAGAQAV